MNDIIKNIEAAQIRGYCSEETGRRSKRDFHCKKEFQRNRC